MNLGGFVSGGLYRSELANSYHCLRAYLTPARRNSEAECNPCGKQRQICNSYANFVNSIEGNGGLHVKCPSLDVWAYGHVISLSVLHHLIFFEVVR